MLKFQDSVYLKSKTCIQIIKTSEHQNFVKLFRSADNINKLISNLTLNNSEVKPVRPMTPRGSVDQELTL